MDFLTPRSRHRLFLVLPLFAALALAGIWQTQSSDNEALYAAVVTEDAEGHVETDVTSVAAKPLMVAGTALIDIWAGDTRLQGWHGAFQSDLHDNGALTIAALTTPVFVSRAEESWLVPVGMQLTINPNPAADESLDAWMKARRPLRLPAHYVREYLPAAERLLEHAPALPKVTYDHEAVTSLIGSALRFAVAAKAALERENINNIANIKASLQLDTNKTFDELLSMDALQNALRQAESRDQLDILSLAVSHNRVPVVLPYILGNADAAVIARYHPLLQDKAWVLPSPAMSDRMRLLELSLLPLSDRSDHITPKLAIRGWADEWAELEEGVTADITTSVVPLLEQDIARLHADGYPARSGAYAAALTHVIPSTSAALQMVENEDMAILLRPTPVSSQSSQSSVSSSASSAKAIPARIWTAAEVQAQLSQAGFMLTSQSVFEPKGEMFRIANVVLATPSGDQVLHFMFEPTSATVSGIEDKGAILPYSLPLLRYMAWVKGE